jgi:hypothetical protein
MFTSLLELVILSHLSPRGSGALQLSELGWVTSSHLDMSPQQLGHVDDLVTSEVRLVSSYHLSSSVAPLNSASPSTVNRAVTAAA